MSCKTPGVSHQCTCGKHSAKPFTEELGLGNKITRHFNLDAPDNSFKWNTDDEDRWLTALNENDWKFQFNNESPQSIEPDKIIQIPKGLSYRLIKGNSPLSISLTT
jgi:hypothetical protein